MSTKPNDGGERAFPSKTDDKNRSYCCTERDSDGFPMKVIHHPGMDLRDWFAGMCLQSVITQAYGSRVDVLAERCYQMADAMLAERENKR